MMIIYVYLMFIDSCKLITRSLLVGCSQRQNTMTNINMTSMRSSFGASSRIECELRINKHVFYPRGTSLQ